MKAHPTFVSQPSVVAQAIPCIVLSHGLDDINILSINGISACDPRLLIDIFHNPSPSESGDFVEHVLEMLERGALQSVTIFEQNISNNAILLALLRNRRDYLRSPYLIISDCDVLPPSGLIDEQLYILESHPEILGCGMRVDPSEWSNSLSVKEACLQKFNSPENEEDDYLAVQGGVWMLMLRSAELFDIVDALIQSRRRFTDGNVGLFSYLLFNQKVVSTKHSTGSELNRCRDDARLDRESVSAYFAEFSPEPLNSGYSIWNHDRVCAGTRYSANGQDRFLPLKLPPAAPQHRGALLNDSVLCGLGNKLDSFKVAEIVFAVKSIQPSHEDKLSIVICEPMRKAIPTGIAFKLRGRRVSILFASLSDRSSLTNRIPLEIANFGLSLLKMKSAAALDALALVGDLVSLDCRITGVCFTVATKDSLSISDLEKYALTCGMALSTQLFDKSKLRFELFQSHQR